MLQNLFLTTKRINEFLSEFFLSGMAILGFPSHSSYIYSMSFFSKICYSFRDDTGFLFPISSAAESIP